jgi:hypothetical protein
MAKQASPSPSTTRPTTNRRPMPDVVSIRVAADCAAANGDECRVECCVESRMPALYTPMAWLADPDFRPPE